MVDDGSTDESCEIIESYSDERIRLIRNRHDFIGSLNLMLSEARGKYIARMDSDDVMRKNRLEVQYHYMENHPDVALTGCNQIFFGASNGILRKTNEEQQVTVRDLLSNCISHPTIMARKSVIEEYNLNYESSYIYAEDYRLWVRMAQLGLRLINLPDVLLEYRVSVNQVCSVHHDAQMLVTERIQGEVSRWLSRDEEEYARKHPVVIEPTNKKLTVIIPFLNENVEVARTVASVRQTIGNAVDILVINDQSNDGFNYRESLNPYHVYYVYNEERKGVAASRDLGVRLCQTPYFLLLDAHMRFYDDRWLSRIVSLLENDDRCLLCSQTKILQKEEDGSIIEGDISCSTYGAYLPFVKENYIPDIVWRYVEDLPDETIEPIPAVLGAGYATSKRYWTYLRGLEGLLLYGSDEAYISLKVWLEGGRCLLLKDVIIGHVYRTEAPYRMYNEIMVYNNLFISTLLFPQSLNAFAFAIACHKDRNSFVKACVTIQQNATTIDELKNYYKEIFTKPFSNIIKLNRILRPEQKSDLEIKSHCLPEIFALLSDKINTIPLGLYSGAAGFMVGFSHYKNFSGEENCSNEINILFRKIQNNIRKSDFGIGFSDGYSGIGWALIYLCLNNLWDGDFDEVLSLVDNKINNMAFNILQDNSFDTGFGGLLCYIIARMKFAVKQKKENPFDDAFCVKMREKAEEIINIENDLYLLYFALQYLDLFKNGVDSNDLSPALHDWIDFPTFLPKNKKYWSLSLRDGCLGYGLLIMLALNNKQQ
ncbi:MAG: glycosyltransferase [Bacteroidaceae bacterium]